MPIATTSPEALPPSIFISSQRYWRYQGDSGGGGLDSIVSRSTGT